MDSSILKLRKIVKDILAPTISLHRKSRGTLDNLSDAEVTEEEINRLLFSIPYLDRPLCYYLMSDGIIANSKTGLWVTANWYRDFQKRIEYWAESLPWLQGELILIHYPGFMGRAMVDDDQLTFPRLLFQVKAY